MILFQKGFLKKLLEPHAGVWCQQASIAPPFKLSKFWQMWHFMDRVGQSTHHWLELTINNLPWWSGSSILVKLQPDGLGCSPGTIPISSLPSGFDPSTVGVQESDRQKQESCRMAEEYCPLAGTWVLKVNLTSNFNPSRIKSCATWLCLKCSHFLRVTSIKGLYKI